jgi:hypothetical protein
MGRKSGGREGNPEWTLKWIISNSGIATISLSELSFPSFAFPSHPSL